MAKKTPEEMDAHEEHQNRLATGQDKAWAHEEYSNKLPLDDESALTRARATKGFGDETSNRRANIRFEEALENMEQQAQSDQLARESAKEQADAQAAQWAGNMAEFGSKLRPTPKADPLTQAQTTDKSLER